MKDGKGKERNERKKEKRRKEKEIMEEGKQREKSKNI